MSFGDYLIFVDESGDHSLDKVDPGFPIFVLVFVLIHKRVYAHDIVPALKEFKFRHRGHDGVILHSHEIRKPKDDFGFLTVREKRELFLADLNDLMTACDATIVSTAIEKDRLAQKYRKPFNPYHIALGLGLERIGRFLLQKGQKGKMIHLVAEARGAREDKDLELEFRRVPGRSFRLSDQPPCPQAGPAKSRFRYRSAQADDRWSGALSIGGLETISLIQGIKSERPRSSPRPNADQKFPIHLK